MSLIVELGIDLPLVHYRFAATHIVYFPQTSDRQFAQRLLIHTYRQPETLSNGYPSSSPISLHLLHFVLRTTSLVRCLHQVFHNSKLATSITTPTKRSTLLQFPFSNTWVTLTLLSSDPEDTSPDQTIATPRMAISTPKTSGSASCSRTFKKLFQLIGIAIFVATSVAERGGRSRSNWTMS